MKIIVAKNIGFCFGVKRAIEIAKRALKEGPSPVQFLGELINNEVVIKQIERKGGRFIPSLKQVKSGTLVIRAHGMPPFSLPKNVLIKDATCPLVKRVREAAKSLRKEGYSVVIIGDKNHPEIKGIQGYVGNQAIIIEKGTDAKKLKNFKKIGVVAQTTQNLDNINRILKILRKRAKTVKWINTLCSEVFSRQKELRRIIKKAEGILVIGSLSSANTRRLAEIAKKAKKPVWRVNSLNEVKKQKFHNINSLGIVSGTSAPDWEVEKIKRYLISKNK